MTDYFKKREEERLRIFRDNVNKRKIELQKSKYRKKLI